MSLEKYGIMIWIPKSLTFRHGFVKPAAKFDYFKFDLKHCMYYVVIYTCMYLYVIAYLTRNHAQSNKLIVFCVGL